MQAKVSLEPDKRASHSGMHSKDVKSLVDKKNALRWWMGSSEPDTLYMYALSQRKPVDVHAHVSGGWPRRPSLQTFAVALTHDDRDHEDLDWSDVLERLLALSLHAYQRASLLLRGGLLTLPVVWYMPRACLRSSSLTAPGASILLPRMRKGTFESSSIDSNASSSSCALSVMSYHLETASAGRAFDSENRS